MAAAPAPQPPAVQPQPTMSQAQIAAPTPANVTSPTVRLANMTSLYSDKLTDTAHEQ